MKTKVSVYTHKLEDKEPSIYLKQIAEAAKIAKQHQSSILVLPGNSLGEDEPTNKNAVSAQLQQIADTEHIGILCELGNKDTRYIAPHQKQHQISEQIFKDGSETTREAVRHLILDFEKGSRTFITNGKRFGVMLCGENNIVTHERVNDNKAVLRHPDVDWFWDYDVLLNPTHILMGQANLLHKRFEYLSQNNRTVIHCACDTSKSNNAKRAIYVYQNGERIVQGDLTNDSNLPVHIEANWRLVTIELN